MANENSPFSSRNPKGKPTSRLWAMAEKKEIQYPLQQIGRAIEEWRRSKIDTRIDSKAKRIGVSIGEWNGWEQGKALPSDHSLKLLEAELKYSPEEIIAEALLYNSAPSADELPTTNLDDDSPAESESPNSRFRSILWDYGYEPDIAGRVIETIRKLNGPTQREFAEKLGITSSAVSNWENGKTNPSNWSLSQIEKIFGIGENVFLQRCAEEKDTLVKSQKHSAGSLEYFSRNEDQSALNAQQYAEAISRLFRIAKDDFCFGLFGPWGRGKTHLIKLVERTLKNGGNEQEFPLEKIQYKTVWFSAWKYRTTPEVWVHLYETLSNACYETSWKSRIPRQIRTNIYRQGFSKLILSVFSITLIASSIVNLQSEVVQNWMAVPGIGGFAFLASMVFQERKSQKKSFLITPKLPLTKINWVCRQ